MTRPTRLHLPRQFYDEMIAQARAELPNECCGMLAGVIVDGEAWVSRRYPLVNTAASPVRYEAEPRSLFLATKDMRKVHIELLAFYHSHPTSPAVPSKTDLAMNFYGPDVICFIISLNGVEPVLRGWHLGEADFSPADWTFQM
jgi:proteasome lid subunit RPN8/RPN11